MNKTNFMILARYLLEGQWKHNMHFTMDYFNSSLDDEDDYKHVIRSIELVSCQTAGCAVGHATFIPELPDKGYYEGYSTWSRRVFWNFVDGVPEDGADLSIHHKQGSWCFDPDWSLIDNTPEGAAKRILYLLENDGEVPEDYSAFEISKIVDPFGEGGAFVDSPVADRWVAAYQDMKLPEEQVDFMEVVRQFSE